MVCLLITYFFRCRYKPKEWLVKQSFVDATCSSSARNDSGGCAKTSSVLRDGLLKVITRDACKCRHFEFILYLEGNVDISEELKDLYSVYQQEIHASTYTGGAARAQSRIVYDTKLPPIYKRT